MSFFRMRAKTWIFCACKRSDNYMTVVGYGWPDYFAEPGSLGSPGSSCKWRFSRFWKHDLSSPPVAALWGTSISKVPFHQMVILTGGWPDWRRLYIWNGPTNLGTRLPVDSCRKSRFSKLQNKKPVWSTCPPPATPCCPLNCNGLCNYEYQTVHPEAQ